MKALLEKVFQSVCANNFKIQMHKEKARDMGIMCSTVCPSLGSLYMFELSSLTLHPSFFFFFICCFLSSLVSAPFFREKKKRAMVLRRLHVVCRRLFPQAHSYCGKRDDNLLKKPRREKEAQHVSLCAARSPSDSKLTPGPGRPRTHS